MWFRGALIFKLFVSYASQASRSAVGLGGGTFKGSALGS